VWGLSLDTGEVRPFACGSPRCEPCAPYWGRQLRARLARVLPKMVGPAWRGNTPLKFGTFTLPPEIDAGRPSLSVVEADSVFWRRFKRFFAKADPRGRVFVWKREVGPRGGRLHRHLAIVTRLSNRALVDLARRAGYGLVVNVKLATGGALSNYLAKYVSKPGVGLDAWPSRTRWAQTIIPAVPRQVLRGTPEPRGWVAVKFPRIVSEPAVRAAFDFWLAHREAPACGVDETECVLWLPRQDDARTPRPPPARTLGATDGRFLPK